MQKQPNRSRCCLGRLTHVGPKNHVLDGVKMERINSQLQGVTSRGFGLFPNHFGHLLYYIQLRLVNISCYLIRNSTGQTSDLTKCTASCLHNNFALCFKKLFGHILTIYYLLQIARSITHVYILHILYHFEQY